MSVSVADALSGAGAFSLQSYTIDDPDPGANAVTGFAIETASTSGFVVAQRRGNGDAGVYTFTYMGLAVAGNAGSCVATVIVPHDSGE